VTDESREFLDSLQGNDIETLRRADGVAYLEYFLPNPLLKQITLVDTPGTGAVVEEHVDRTSEFMRLNAELRERHDEETRRLGDTADAVIYLVGQVARVTDQAFLREFAETTGGGSSALNAIGVLSKIELQPEVMSRRHELSAKIATQLEDTLNTVIPVAAGVHREMAGLKSGDRAELRRIVSTLRRIPPDALDMLLTSEEFFCDFDLPDSPVPPEERRGLVGSMKWAVFTTIARVAADGALSLDGVEARLEEMSGFGPLWDVLHRHFIERGHVLRCRRITADAREALGDIRYIHLPRLRKEARNEKARLERFLAFINRSGGDSETALELEGFVRERLDVDARLRGVEALHAELDAELGGLLVELVEYTEDFEALQNSKRRTMLSPTPTSPSFVPSSGCTAARSQSGCRRGPRTPSTSGGGKCTGGRSWPSRPPTPSNTPWRIERTRGTVSSSMKFWADSAKAGTALINAALI